MLKRPKLARYFSSKDVEAILGRLVKEGELMAAGERRRLSRDPKDDLFIELAIDGNADFLVTGDQDLLVLQRVGRTRIVTPAMFVELNTSSLT